MRAGVVALVIACRSSEPPPPRIEVAPPTPATVAPSPPAPPPPLGDANLVVRIRDEHGQPLPARLTFRGVARTRTPVFTHGDVGVDQPGGVLAYSRAFVIGDARLRVHTGTYQIWIDHGPEWDAVQRIVHLVESEPTELEVTLRHVVDTPGWISGDFHVHAERSNDSTVPMRHRVLQFVADGVDLIVATDHDAVTDYAPTIAELGLGDQLASLRGDEVTTHGWGHFGAFPLPADAPAVASDRAPDAIFADLRALAPEAVIDVHHPRLEDGHIGYFHLGKLDAARLHAERPGFSFEFDAIEVLNGYQDPDRRSIDAVLQDWFAFLRRGRRVTATGNSDSHHLTFNLGGYPRNYVEASGPTGVARAVKAGRSYFTTGPVVELSVGALGIGDTVALAGKPLALRIVVRAPAWIDVSRITVLVDGVAQQRLVPAKTVPIRFDKTVSVSVPRDGFVIVRVDGDRPMEPMVGDGEKFRVYPLAITNPIWIDADGDGVVTPVLPRQ